MARGRDARALVAAILDGVSDGETVVTAGSFLLKSEMKKGELGEEGH